MISAVGLAGALVLLMLLTIRGVHIFIAAPLAALLVVLTSGIAWLPPLSVEGEPDFMTAYMAGFTGFFAAWFPMFLLGAIFGELMGTSGAAASVGRAIIKRVGARHAVLAVVIACAVLTYGGVSVFIVAFSVYALAVQLFREAGVPRRFIPAALAFGSVTFTMTSAGSPEIQNLIPMPFLGTTAYAGWQVSLICAIAMAITGYVWLQWMVGRAMTAGESFESRPEDEQTGLPSILPNPLISLLPLVLVLATFLVLQFPQETGLAGTVLPPRSLEKWALVGALGAGIVAVLMVGRTSLKETMESFGRGATGSVIAITNTCAVVGFGTVAQLSPAFTQALTVVQELPGDPLIGAAVAVTTIAAITGSASGGQSIALPLLAPHYLAEGVNPQELHRVVAISSGALDSLPHNGYVVTTIRSICGETYDRAYPAVAALTVIVPTVGLALALLLFSV